MQVEVRGLNITVKDSLQAHVERQMDFALSQFDSWISNVTVYLEDINGPRKGVDKQCRILINIKGGKTIKVEDVDLEFETAVNRAANRVGQAVSREVERRRDKKGGATFAPPADVEVEE